MKLRPVPFRLLILCSALLLAGCASLEPKYEVPAVDTPVAFKEGEGAWVPAAPADTLERGLWWELFGDPVLNGLVQQVEVSNQNIAAAVAAYDQARAVTREQRASLFPQVNLDASSNRTGGPERPTTRSYRVNIGASWEPDVFGRLRLGVQSARTGEQVAEADVAAARLAAQGELAANYFACARPTWPTCCSPRRWKATRAPCRSPATATKPASSRAPTCCRPRASSPTAAPTCWGWSASERPSSTPWRCWWARRRRTSRSGGSELERADPEDPARGAQHAAAAPADIAAAERQVAQANARIGIARAGYYPSFSLNGSLGSTAASIGDIFKASNLVWAVGASWRR
jgi:outer membrane protein TolC